LSIGHLEQHTGNLSSKVWLSSGNLWVDSLTNQLLLLHWWSGLKSLNIDRASWWDLTGGWSTLLGWTTLSWSSSLWGSTTADWNVWTTVWNWSSWSVWSHWARSATATLNRSASWESVVRIAWGTNVWWDALAWHSV